MNKTFRFGIDDLRIAELKGLVEGSTKGVLVEEALASIRFSQQEVESIAAGKQIVYGVNTGFGPLCNTIISPEHTRQLQTNILRSHSVGVGKPIPLSLAKAMMICKVQALAQGYSGIREETLQRLLWHIEQDVIPKVPEKGSVGASGDLAPLAHMVLPLIGLGEVWDGTKWVNSASLLQKHQMEPLQLGPKEGLALINGTQFILAFAFECIRKMKQALDLADIIGAMSLEGILGSAAPFKDKLHQLRPFHGALWVAHRLRVLLKDSEMVASHLDCNRVQDPYSIRCMPQVHGASRNAWLHAYHLVSTELNAVTDNPIILSQKESISGGNFHGQLLALPLDYLTLAAAELGNISDRRTYLLLEGTDNGLPKLLMTETGINSGFMLPQYTSAALVSENKSLCFPASADSIPTSLGQEDHVSMGSISGRKCLEVINNLEYILAVELLCAAQAFDYRRPLKSGIILERCHELIREHIAHAEEDRIFSQDMDALHALISGGDIVQLADSTAMEQGLNLNADFDKDLFV